MKKIKLFTYLDEYKMYSISSQIFEGLTEYVLSATTDSEHIAENQKGPKNSGRALGKIIVNQKESQEKKFLHDYAFNVFEQELISRKYVLEIDKKNFFTSISQLKDFGFVKIKGKILFNDIKIIKETLRNFISISESIAWVANWESIINVKSEFEEKINASKDKVKKNSLKNECATQINHLINDSKNTLLAGVGYDSELLDRLSFLLNYGYKDHFEVRIQFDDLVLNEVLNFSAVLDRGYLKENEDLLISKYSRESEFDFCIFGLISQVDKIPISHKISTNHDLKEILLNLILKISSVEDAFIGKLSNEIIIDPIAIYQEI